MHEPTGDFERLTMALRDQWDIPTPTCDLSLLTKLQPVLRKGKWQVTVAIYNDHTGGAPRLRRSGRAFMRRVFSMATDLGSTTVAAICVIYER